MIFYLSLVRGTGIRVRIRVRTVLVREYYHGTYVHVRDVHVYRYTCTSVSGESSDPINIDTTITVEAGKYIQLIGELVTATPTLKYYRGDL